MKKSKLVVFLVLFLLLFIFLYGCSKSKEIGNDKVKQQEETSRTVTITDMAGRVLEIPREIEKVYCKSPVGTIMMYTLAPDKLVGWNYKFTENERKYIKPEYRDLPVLGGWFGKNNTSNIEEILKASPDIIIAMGTINNTEIDVDNNIQEQTGIPVVIIDNDSLEKIYEAYLFLGEIIGEEDKAKELGDYCKSTINDAQNKSKMIDKENKVRVYYAEGSEGLQTEVKGSYRTETIRLVGGENVAEGFQDSTYGRREVSLEQVLLWNPDVIISAAESDEDNNTSFYEIVYQNKDWEDIKAVRNKKVYGIPQNPFGWFDRPTSVNRIIGIKWLGSILYPEVYDYDLVKEIKKFYSMFYHYDISDEEIEKFLNTSQ